MNFVCGKMISDSESYAVLERIDKMLMDTLRKPPLDISLVINACDALAKNIDTLDIIKRLPELGIGPLLAEMYIKQISQMLTADAIKERMRIELGDSYSRPRALTYAHSGATAIQAVAPLGVLFHVTAGNVDGLPFISLLDGLLTGNINIVKLPKEEGGITILLLEYLLKIEPSLQEYIYVFNHSSKDIHTMRKLATVADAIIVWGGDEAVSAVRKLAAPNTKIIEWGHKISFAYVTKAGAKRDALEKLAFHICLTNQFFCSSCQGIFLDTDDMQEIYDFCENFLPLFEKTCQENPLSLDASANIFIQAEVTLQNYHRQIENKHPALRVFRDQNCSITAQPDSKLEPSIMSRSIWVKPLKRNEIINLRPYKSYLQTAALLCTEQEHSELSQKLVRAGLVKISDGLELSSYALGEAHDGVFALRCYTKLVSVQKPRP